MENVAMQTLIKWQSPKDNPPPFNKLIMVLIGYQSSADFGATWENVFDPYSVQVAQDSPNDTLSQREFDLFASGEMSFSECRFFVTDRQGEKYYPQDLRSDAIAYWSEFPDFSHSN